ncbi:integrator complex subunit 15 isoform 2-T2 [Sarcophilus harrisii]
MGSKRASKLGRPKKRGGGLGPEGKGPRERAPRPSEERPRPQEEGSERNRDCHGTQSAGTGSSEDSLTKRTGSQRSTRQCLRGTTMSDIRHSLIRRDALSAAKEVLYHLDIYFSSQLQNAPLPIVDKGPIELLEEFIFQVPKERNSQPKRLNSLQELQLLEIMCNYFQEQAKDSVRQIIFSSLFSPQGNKADDSRMVLLGKLVSMAVAVCRIPVLECAASWLQRTPAGYCVRLAKALVDDYCSLVPGSIQTLKQIFSASPRFCCQFITAVTAFYDLSSDELIPPLDLLEIIVNWIFEDPRLILITFLNTPIAANLPIGFLELTPLTGLIHWCVKAPLAYKRRKKTTLPNGHMNNKIAKESVAGVDRDFHLLYSKLHLSVLQVLMMLQVHLTEKNLYGRLGLVLFDHMVPLVEEINRLSDELNPLNASKEIELSLDRLAQALQVAMASGALLCTRGKPVQPLESCVTHYSR